MVEAKFRRDLLKMKNNEEFTDLTLIVGEKIIKVHQNIMAASSTVFKSLIKELKDKQVKEITINGFDYEVVNGMVNFIYSNELTDLNEDLLLDLIITASKFKMSGLKWDVQHELIPRITEVNAIKFFKIASKYDAKLLSIQVVAHIFHFDLDFVNSDEWRNLDTETIRKITQFRMANIEIVPFGFRIDEDDSDVEPWGQDLG